MRRVSFRAIERPVKLVLDTFAGFIPALSIGGVDGNSELLARVTMRPSMLFVISHICWQLHEHYHHVRRD